MSTHKTILKLKINDINDTSRDTLDEYYKAKYKTYDGDSGVDLLIPNEVICKARKVTYINHRICCEMIQEKNIFFKNIVNIPYLLVPRSSLSKTPLLMANSIGIIDRGYRGNITAAVYNTSNKDYNIFENTKLFQIILPTLNSFTVEIVKQLSISDRGDKGYGSTSKKTTR